MIQQVSEIKKELQVTQELQKIESLNINQTLKSINETIKTITKKIEHDKSRMHQNHYLREIKDLKNKLNALERQEQLRTQRVANSPKIGSIREFCPKTESEKRSSESGINKRRRMYEKIESKDIKEFRLDSSISRSIKEDGFLLKEPELNFDFDFGDDLDKTPNKKKDFNEFNALLKVKDLESRVLDRKGNKTPVKSRETNNIRNFDDFKVLLKDLKMTLNKSDFSEFQDDLNENIEELETLMTNYNALDRQMGELIEDKNQKPDQNTSLLDKNVKGLLKVNKSSSVNYGKDTKNKYIVQLEELREGSNFKFYQEKLRELRTQPLEFNSFMLTVKRELDKRSKKFETLKEFLV